MITSENEVPRGVVSSIEVECLDGAKFLHYWPMIEQELESIPHVWANWWTLDSIQEMVLNGRWICWGVGTKEQIRGIAFTQIAIYPANRIFQVVIAFGEGLLELLPNLEAAWEKFASAQECTMAEWSGRPGWGSEARKHGFKQVATTYSKKLQNVRIQ